MYAYLVRWEPSIITKKISGWIEEQAKRANASGVVVGMSGGIDSSVVAVLSKEALGDNVLGVYMPCYSADRDREDAFMVAEKFGIRMKEVVLDMVFDTLLNAIDDDSRSCSLCIANLKPRLRMMVLYYFANKSNYLVAGTGNASELTVGYFTKYGDGGCDILPIGGIVKHEVKAVADYLGIPERIVNKPPSAGLWEGQTDEKEMGISYEELDRYILGIDVSDDVRRKIERMRDRSAHKCLSPSVCIID